MKKRSVEPVREAWLNALVDAVRPTFKREGFPLPDKVRVGCGWPSSRALSRTRRTLGECWTPSAARDHVHNIVVSLYLDNSYEVAGTLIHELSHAATGVTGHKGDFVACIRAVGLLGKPTEAHIPDSTLTRCLDDFIAKFGAYPHASVDGSNRKKQGTRLIKLTCSHCGYVVRTTRKWIEKGIPLCPSGCPFTVADIEENEQ